jgi:isocitrate lyase
MIAGLDPYGPPLIADMDTGYGGKIFPPVFEAWQTSTCEISC